MLLSVEKLFKKFGGVVACDNVDWSIGSGETQCIIGPNGAGTSTFFQLLTGRHAADHGRIIFKGGDISRLPPFARANRGIAMKPQTLGVFPELTVEHNMRLTLQRHMSGAALRDAIEARLVDLDLAHTLNRQARELSHGQRQWLGLGMAIGSNPDLLLLDEPTAGMSTAETQRTVDLIHRIGATGTAVLVVEHDMAFVRQLAVPTTVFHQGRIFASGTLSDIETNLDVQRLYLGKQGVAKLRN